MFSDPGDALSEGFGLTKKQRQLVIRVAWVVAVSGHVLWICGFMGWAGLNPPFARAEDVRKNEEKIEAIQSQVEISARLQIIQEIRTQKRIYCTTSDDRARDSTLRYLNQLVLELRKVSDIQESPTPDCPKDGQL